VVRGRVVGGNGRTRTAAETARTAVAMSADWGYRRRRRGVVVGVVVVGVVVGVVGVVVGGGGSSHGTSQDAPSPLPSLWLFGRRSGCRGTAVIGTAAGVGSFRCPPLGRPTLGSSRGGSLLGGGRHESLGGFGMPGLIHGFLPCSFFFAAVVGLFL